MGALTRTTIAVQVVFVVSEVVSANGVGFECAITVSVGGRRRPTVGTAMHRQIRHLHPSDSLDDGTAYK